MSKVFSDFATPISSAQPEGIDIEYDARFIDIQSLSEGKPEQQYGDVIIEAEEPDWRAIERLCTQILSESKDIRVFCYYTQAMTASYGVKGFYKGCEALFFNLEKYWDVLYPKLVDEDGEYDTFYRLGSIELLLSNNGIVNQLLETNLIRSPNKKDFITLKLAISVLTGNNEELYPGGKQKLLQDMKVAYRTNQDELIFIEKSLKAVESIEKIFSEKLENESLDFKVIKKPLQLINEFIINNVKLEQESAETVDDNNNEIQESLDSMSNNVYSTNAITELDSIKIKDREDVKIVLEKLVLYFRVKEPSHPAPLFIERLKRLLDMDFYDILKDISPGSLNDLEIIIGKSENDEDNQVEE